ncbi:glycosyltransferase family 4 protein [Halorhodospira sp. 9621]|nr:glycosyltransferase family 4 protein [Halorhodospira sp. 9621]
MTPPRRNPPDLPGIEHLLLPWPSWIPGRALKPVWGIWRQRRTLREWKPRRVHLLIFSETLYLAALLAARLSGARLVIASRSNLIRRHQIRQSLRRNPLSRVYHALEHTVARRIWTYTLRRANRIIVQSPAALEQLQEAYGLPSDRFRVVENDVPQLSKPPRSTLPEQPARLLYIGSSSPLKGLDILLDALPNLPERAPSVEAVTVVGVRERTVHRLQRKAVNNGPTLTVVPRSSEIYDLMGAHDLVVAPSREDQFPNVLLEALACGTPAIGSRRDGIPHILGDERLLFEPTPHALLECLASVSTPEGYGHAAAKCRDARERLQFPWEQYFLDAVTQHDPVAPPHR